MKLRWTKTIICFFYYFLLTTILTLLTSYNSNAVTKSYIGLQDKSLHKKIVIIPFDSTVNDLKNKATMLSQTLNDHLTQQKDLIVLDTTKLDNLNQLNTLKLTELKKNMAKLDTNITIVNSQTCKIKELVQTASRQLGIIGILTGMLTNLSIRKHSNYISGYYIDTIFLTIEIQLRLLKIDTGTVAAQQTFICDIKINDKLKKNTYNEVISNTKLINNLLTKLSFNIKKWAINQIKLIPLTS